MIFLPFAIDRHFRRLPWVTIALIALNTAICLLTVGNIDGIAEVLGFKLDVNGFYTWFTSMFLHADLIGHLGGNMYFLWLFGSVVEDGIGKLRFIGLYILGGLAASLSHGIMMFTFLPQYRNVPAIGASGALAAIVGLFAVRYYRNRMKIWWFIMFRAGVFELSAIAGVALWGLRELWSGIWVLGGAASSVANWAHIGGLAFGVGAGLLLGFSKDADRDYLGEAAQHYEVAGAYSAAASQYAKLAAASPTDADILLQKAWALAAGGDGDGAVVDVATAIDVLSRADRKLDIVEAFAKLRSLTQAGLAPRTLQTIGSTAESLKRWDVAAHAYYELLTAHDGTREAERALFRLAHVYLAMGKRPEARQTWAAFAKRYPASEWIAYADGALLTEAAG